MDKTDILRDKTITLQAKATLINILYIQKKYKTVTRDLLRQHAEMGADALSSIIKELKRTNYLDVVKNTPKTYKYVLDKDVFFDNNKLTKNDIEVLKTLTPSLQGIVYIAMDKKGPIYIEDIASTSKISLAAAHSACKKLVAKNLLIESKETIYSGENYTTRSVFTLNLFLDIVADVLDHLYIEDDEDTSDDNEDNSTDDISEEELSEIVPNTEKKKSTIISQSILISKKENQKRIPKTINRNHIINELCPEGILEAIEKVKKIVNYDEISKKIGIAGEIVLGIIGQKMAEGFIFRWLSQHYMMSFIHHMMSKNLNHVYNMRAYWMASVVNYEFDYWAKYLKRLEA